jgi:hypothetical protein
MRVQRGFGVVLMAVLSLGGCSLFGDDEEEVAAEAAVETAVRREPVESVERLELGRTRNGVAITAIGTAAGLGYSRPILVPRREGQPDPEGMLEFDFFVSPPDPSLDLPPGQGRALEVRADRLVPLATVSGVRGIRIHGLRRGVQVQF